MAEDRNEEERRARRSQAASIFTLYKDGHAPVNVTSVDAAAWIADGWTAGRFMDGREVDEATRKFHDDKNKPAQAAADAEAQARAKAEAEGKAKMAAQADAQADADEAEAEAGQTDAQDGATAKKASPAKKRGR